MSRTWRAFIERVEVQPAGGRIDGGGRSPSASAAAVEPVQHAQHQALDGDRPGRSPIVEVRAVAQIEAGQEWPAGQGGGRGQVAPRATRGQPLELGQVHAHRRAVQRDTRAIDAQGLARDGACA